MKIKVLIVDDEFLVRLGMKTYIEDSKAEIEVSGALGSAEEALEFCMQNPVDVLLTDVKMFGMSGIDLIREVKARGLQMGIIVLSCYENFSYAKEALNSGADRYLLKHEIDEAELLETIEAVYWQKANLLKNAILQPPDQSLETIEPDAEQFDYFVGIVEFREEYDDAFRRQEDNLDAAIVVRLIEEIIRRMGKGKCYLRHGRVICVFYLDKVLSMEEKTSQIAKMFYQASSDIYNYFNKQAYLYVGGAAGGAAGIQETLSRLKRLLGYRFYESETYIVFEEEVPHYFSKTQCKFPDIVEYDISSQRWMEQTSQLLQLYFDDAAQNLVAPEIVKNEVDTLLHTIFFHAKKYFGISAQNFFGDTGILAHTRMEELATLALLRECFSKTLAQVVGCAKDFPANKKLCGQIKAHIQENYREDLSLRSVAKAFCISPGYLSKVFKANTGTNFVRYLSGIRVREAKVLLSTTTLTLDEIAERVGFSSPNYLIRVFKKITDQTISEYRKNTN